jgi:hypothetical protein
MNQVCEKFSYVSDVANCIFDPNHGHSQKYKKVLRTVQAGRYDRRQWRRWRGGCIYIKEAKIVSLHLGYLSDTLLIYFKRLSAVILRPEYVSSMWDRLTILEAECKGLRAKLTEGDEKFARVTDFSALLFWMIVLSSARS